MLRVYKRPGREVGIRVGYHRGFEQHGRTFLTIYDSDSVGGQCSKCHAIVWTTGTPNKTLRQTKPDEVPDYGPAYTQFVMQTRRGFLKTLSPCPQCGAIDSFDLFVNNMTLTRYEDGTEKEKIIGKEFYDVPDPKDAWVWWAEFA